MLFLLLFILSILFILSFFVPRFHSEDDSPTFAEQKGQGRKRQDEQDEQDETWNPVSDSGGDLRF